MIPDELDTLRTAAERDDRIAAMTVIERLDVAFERDRLEYQRFDLMATLLDQRIDDENADTAKSEYRDAVAELEQRRIELDQSTLRYIQGEDSSAALVESIDAVGEVYRVCRKRMVSLEMTVSSVQTPPLLVFWGDSALEIPKGIPTSAELTLSSVSRSHPDPIPINIESEIPANISPSIIGSLDENEVVTVRVELSPSNAGEFDVFVTATGEANVDRFRFTALVLTKHDYVLRANRLTGSLETILDSTGGQQNGLRNQVRTLRRQLGSISDDIQDRRRPAHSIDNRLNAIRNNIEALKNQASASSPNLQRQEAIYLLRDISGAIDSAIEALS